MLERSGLAVRPLEVMRFRQALTVVAASLLSASLAHAQEPKPDPDLIKLGRSVLPDDEPAPARPIVGADAGAAADADTATEGGAPDAAALEPSASPPSASQDTLDAGGARPPADKVTPPSPPPKGRGTAPVGLGPGARQARIDNGQNLPLQGAAESPLATLGVPPQAVPVVATTATAGVMAVWPFLTKALAGLAKSIFGAFLKSRAKQGKAIDKTQKTIEVMGFVVRPVELASLLFGAAVYGLAIGYAFQGRNMSPAFFVSQEALVIAIYYARSFVRFAYERAYKLPTQFRFWPSGGLLCLVSAYLGNPLGTVGYELEETRTAEDAERIVKMKAWLIGVSLVMALGFFAANVVHPNKVLQTGRVMMSGMMLAEILPITPMPGLKIHRWRPAVWWGLFVTIVPTFVLINFLL
jgi:hypothetical protein